MSLCKFSKSELLSDQILGDCPLELTATQAKQCPCKRREYVAYGGIDLRVIECSYPKTWNGEAIRDPEAFRAVLVGSKSIRKVSDDMSGSLWGGLEIKVLGVCGEYSSGKTLFIQGIDPERTRYYDCEMSSGTYSLLKPENKIDVPKLMGQLKPGYTPLDVFTWWRKDVLALKPGQYSVIAVDTIGDIEQGLADFTASKFAEYGFRTRDAFEKTGGIFWSAVKNEWQALLVEICQRCETFAFAAHMRDEWSGGSTTGKREPQGKETLMKLASLYLHLGRPKDAKGSPSERPDGIVLKSRLAIAKKDDKGSLVKDANGDFVMVSAMPPRISPATPGQIRAYVKTPPNYDKLKKSELVPDVVMSDEEKLRLQAKIADNNARQAEAENKRLDQVAALKGEGTEATKTPAEPVSPKEGKSESSPAPSETPATSTESAPFDSGKATDQPAAATEPNLPGKPYTRSQLIANINALRADLQIPDDPWLASIRKRKADAASINDLSDDQLDNVKCALWTKHTQWKMEQGKKS